MAGTSDLSEVRLGKRPHTDSQDENMDKALVVSNITGQSSTGPKVQQAAGLVLRQR